MFGLAKKQQLVKEYNNAKEFERDVNHMFKKWYQVVAQTGYKGNFKFGKALALGVVFLPLALFGRGKQKVIVTYRLMA